MNTVSHVLLSWLSYSSLVLLLVTVLLLITRSILIQKNYARSTVLKLWLAIPLGLVVCLIAMNLISQDIYLESFVITMPAQLEVFTESTFEFEWKNGLVLLWFLLASWKVLSLVTQYLKTKKSLFKHAKRINQKLYHSEMDISPMAFGIFRPVVILPNYLKQELNPMEVKLVTLHENIHCQRSDPFWRISFELLRCLYWFIPLNRMTKAALIEDQEISCDEQVINQSQEIFTYAQLLLRLNSRLRPFTQSTLLCSSSFNLKERIMKLNQSKNNKHQGVIISLFLLTVFAVSSVSALPKLDTGVSENVKLIQTHTAAPKYPLSAYKKKISGAVELNFVVTTEGTVKDIEVIEATPSGVFDKAAIRAIEQWTFEPIEKATKTAQTFHFNLD